MSREFSLTTIRAMMEQQTGDWPVMLLTIDHDDLDEALHVSSDATTRIGEVDGRIVYGTSSRGTDFVFYPVSMALPSDEDGAAPATTLSIETSQDVMEVVRSLSSPPSLLMELVMGSDPDTVEMSQPDFAIISVDYNINTITAEVTVDFLAGEPMPAGKYRPGSHPGLF